MDYKFDDVCFLFPDMTDEEFERLKKDVKAHGFRVPVEVYNGKIIDGRHRWTIARQLKIKCPIKVVSRETIRAAGGLVPYVISLNLNRRHMTPSQLSMCAAKLANYSLGGRPPVQQPDPGSAKNGDGAKEFDSYTQASEAFGISRPMVSAAATVLEKGTPELIEAVEQGDVSVMDAKDVATSTNKAGQKKALRRFKKGEARSLKSAAKESDDKDPWDKDDDKEPVCKLGNPLPKKLHSSFGDWDEFQECCTLIEKACRLVERLSGEKSGVYLKREADGILKDLRHQKFRIKNNAPYTICPKCRSAGCADCGKSGYVNKIVWDGLPKTGE